jgi:hypothetical protein
LWTRTDFHAPGRSPPRNRTHLGPVGKSPSKAFFFLPLDKNPKSEYDEKGFISEEEKMNE